LIPHPWFLLVDNGNGILMVLRAQFRQTDSAGFSTQWCTNWCTNIKTPGWKRKTGFDQNKSETRKSLFDNGLRHKNRYLTVIRTLWA